MAIAVDPTGPVMKAAAQFISYASGAAGVLTAYYAFKLFTFSTDEERAKDEKRSKKTKEWISKKYGESKEKREKEEKTKKKKLEEQAKTSRRYDLLNPVLGFVINAEQAAERFRDDCLKVKTKDAVEEAEKEMDTIYKNLKRARDRMRVVKLHEKGDQRKYFRHMYEYINHAMHHMEGFKDDLPKETDSDTDFVNKAKGLKAHANKVTHACGYMIKHIHEFIDEAKMENIAAYSGAGAP